MCPCPRLQVKSAQRYLSSPIQAPQTENQKLKTLPHKIHLFRSLAFPSFSVSLKIRFQTRLLRAEATHIYPDIRLRA